MHVLTGLTVNWYVEICILEILLVSGVSILNDSVFRKVFKMLRSKIGLHRWLALGTKNSWL